MKKTLVLNPHEPRESGPVIVQIYVSGSQGLYCAPTLMWALPDAAAKKHALRDPPVHI